MADDKDAGNVIANNEGPSIASSGIQPFRVPVHFIDKNTTIDADFARRYYQYHRFFDLTVIHNLCFNISNSQQPPINSYNDDIGRVIQIYQNVVKNIKQNCRMHLHNMICQRCREVNWLLEGGQEPTSMDDVWNILRSKYNMIKEDGGVRYFSYTYYIIRILSYNINNSWVHKGIEDTVSTYHIELEEPQDRHVRHGFVKIGNLVIDALKKKLHDFELSHFKCTFLERKHNASDKQYLDKYHWIDVVLDPHIVQLPKPVKGFIKSLAPLSENLMTSYHAGQLVQSAKDSNMTKEELLELVETSFDGTVHIHCFCQKSSYMVCSF